MRRKIVNGKLRYVKESSIKPNENAKIKNATKVEVDGIHFRSKLEAYCYNKLLENNLNAEYEGETFTLVEAFVFQGEKIRPITYTPDFTAVDFIIECKGFSNESFPLRAKLFKKKLNESNDNRKYFIVKNQKEVNECITKILNYYEKLKTKNSSDNNNTSDLKFIYWD